jgi:hypothetical protein
MQDGINLARVALWYLRNGGTQDGHDQYGKDEFGGVDNAIERILADA